MKIKKNRFKKILMKILENNEDVSLKLVAGREKIIDEIFNEIYPEPNKRGNPIWKKMI